MAKKINPGIGNADLPRRVREIELLLAQLRISRIQVFTTDGRPLVVDSLIGLGASEDKQDLPVGAFWGLYEKKGDLFLQGGTVTAGSGTKTIEDIKVIDKTTGVGTLEGKSLWVAATVNGIASNNVLLPGCNLVSVDCSVTSTVGTSVPSNTLPTATSTSGKKVYIELGRWTKREFLPSSKGEINISFCPGNFTITRA